MLRKYHHKRVRPSNRALSGKNIYHDVNGKRFLVSFMVGGKIQSATFRYGSRKTMTQAQADAKRKATAWRNIIRLNNEGMAVQRKSTHKSNRKSNKK